MGLGKITVTTSDLDSAAAKIRGLAEQYKTAYTQLYAEVEAMKQAYSGKDNQSFTDQLAQYKNDFEYMHKLMEDYVDKLTKSAAEYRKTQQDIANQAKNLSTGLI